ncbi:transposase [Cupriavidus sp. 8B]
MTRQRRQFDASFKLEVVRMVKDQGLSVGEVCRTMELGGLAYWGYVAPWGLYGILCAGHNMSTRSM